MPRLIESQIQRKNTSGNSVLMKTLQERQGWWLTGSCPCPGRQMCRCCPQRSTDPRKMFSVEGQHERGQRWRQPMIWWPRWRLAPDRGGPATRLLPWQVYANERLVILLLHPGIAFLSEKIKQEGDINLRCLYARGSPRVDKNPRNWCPQPPHSHPTARLILILIPQSHDPQTSSCKHPLYFYILWGWGREGQWRRVSRYFSRIFGLSCHTCIVSYIMFVWTL